METPKKWYLGRSLSGEEDLFWLSKTEADDYNKDLPKHKLAQTLQPVMWDAIPMDDPLSPPNRKSGKAIVASDQGHDSLVANDQLDIASIEPRVVEYVGDDEPPEYSQIVHESQSMKFVAGLEPETSEIQATPSPEMEPAHAEVEVITETTQTAVVTAGSTTVSARGASVTTLTGVFFPDYLKDASKGSAMEAKLTLIRALEIMIGAGNAAKLPQERKFEKDMLVYQIDMANSTVQYEQKDLTFYVYSALIKIQNTGTAPSTLLLDGEPVNITGGQLSLNWPNEQALSTKATVDIENGAISLTATRSLNPDALIRSTTLAQLLTAYCEENKIATDFKTLGLPKILAFLTGRTLSETSNFLYDRVPSALIKFISVDQKINVDRSTAIAHSAAISNGLLVEKAELVLSISNTSETVNKVLKLAELNITFNDVGLTLENVGRPNERMTLHGGVKIENILLSFKVEMAEARPTSQLGAVLWTFTATSTDKLTDLSTIWEKNQNDLTSDRAVPFSTLKVSEMKNNGVGFTLSQPLAGVSKYKLYSVYLATEFNAWKTYLPAEFPLSDATLEARLEIRYPLDSRLRAYGAIVTFKAPITTSKGDSSLRVSLSAEPLATPTDYAYRLFIGGADQGITIMDIATVHSAWWCKFLFSKPGLARLLSTFLHQWQCLSRTSNWTSSSLC